MSRTGPRLAARAVILHENRLLLVNAWPGNKSDLWCAPGGGVERGTSLPQNLQRRRQKPSVQTSTAIGKSSKIKRMGRHPRPCMRGAHGGLRVHQ